MIRVQGGTVMDHSFNKKSYYFFWIAEIVTTVGALPTIEAMTHKPESPDHIWSNVFATVGPND
jgi:hypothetical protein